MGPPPRSLAAEANGCFMVRVGRGPNRIQGCGARDAPDSGLPSDQSKHASTIGEQSDAIKLDTDIPIQGCAKSRRIGHVIRSARLTPDSRLITLLRGWYRPLFHCHRDRPTGSSRDQTIGLEQLHLRTTPFPAKLSYT